MRPLGHALAACTPSATNETAKPPPDCTGSIISGFTPDRGAGATYEVGDSISFSYILSEPGYITFIDIIPTGKATPLFRGFEAAGQHSLPGADFQTTFRVTPPTGTETVKLVYRDTQSGSPSVCDEAMTTFVVSQ